MLLDFSSKVKPDAYVFPGGAISKSDSDGAWLVSGFSSLDQSLVVNLNSNWGVYSKLQFNSTRTWIIV